MNVYDFDKTIYSKDSSIELYKYVVKRNPSIFFKSIGVHIGSFIKYKCNLITKEKYKEGFFCFLKFTDVDALLNDFVEQEISNINNWYLCQKRDDDVVISASPRFLVEEFAKRIGISNVLASEVNKHTGAFYSKNCHDKEKVERFKQKYLNEKVEQFYSDSKSDLPMAQIAEEAYLVHGSTVKKWMLE